MAIEPGWRVSINDNALVEDDKYRLERDTGGQWIGASGWVYYPWVSWWKFYPEGPV